MSNDPIAESIERSEWDTPAQASMTLEQMNAMIQELDSTKALYEARKEMSDDAYKDYENQRKLVLDTLKAQGLENYKAPGVGMVYISAKEVYRVPSDIPTKTQLFNYIKNKYGVDTLMTMTSINHATLNSWANKESEAGAMQIPGLEQPTLQETVGFRRS